MWDALKSKLRPNLRPQGKAGMIPVHHHPPPLPVGKPPTPKGKMSSKRAKAKTTKKRPQRATSNVFAMFDQSQIQEFKEAFNMIDQNRDGFIDKEDLHDMLASLGEWDGCSGREVLSTDRALPVK